MLSKLGGRGYNVYEEPGTYSTKAIDPDFDFDPENDESQQSDRSNGQESRPM